ncbi:MAG: hypothetical protein AAF581_23870, partial [Planctomycetota bacterium]
MVALPLCLCACALEPIRFDRWQIEAPTRTQLAALVVRADETADTLFERFCTDDGAFLYRRPTTPHPRKGIYLDLADQSCWSGYLLATLSFQHVCSPSPVVLQRARLVLAGMERLHAATGVRGLIARGAVPTAVATKVQHHPETWQVAAHDESWSCRVDTSKDQYSGYVLGLVAAMQCIDDPTVQERAAFLLLAIAGHLEDGALRIHGVDGTVTRFGDLRPRIFGAPIGVHSAILLGTFQGALQALDIVNDADDWAALGLETTRDRAQRREQFEHRIQQCLGCLEPLHFALFGIRNYNNDAMTAAGLMAFALAEPLLGQRRQVRAALRDFFPAFVGEGNALFVSLAALYGLRDDFDEDWARRNLVSAPRARAMRTLVVAPPEDLPPLVVRAKNGETLRCSYVTLCESQTIASA